MKRLTAWEWLGLAMMAVGGWAVAWGVWFWSDPPLPGFRYVVSLQWSRIVGGIGSIVLGWMFYRKRAS
jgi:hypothetical protein